MCLTGTGVKRGTNGSKTQSEEGEKHQLGRAGLELQSPKPGEQRPPRAPSGPGAVPGAQRTQGLWKTEPGIRPEQPPGPCAAFTERL